MSDRSFLLPTMKRTCRSRAGRRQAGLYCVKAQPEGVGRPLCPSALVGHGLGEGQAEDLGLLKRHRPEQAAVPAPAGCRRSHPNVSGGAPPRAYTREYGWIVGG